jgi:hypothetical protein
VVAEAVGEHEIVAPLPVAGASEILSEERWEHERAPLVRLRGPDLDGAVDLHRVDADGQTVVDLYRASTVLGFDLAQFMRDAAAADTVNHFVAKAAIMRSVVFGAPVRALCGDQFFVEPEGGEVADGDASVCPLCPLCSIVYAGLPASKAAS